LPAAFSTPWTPPIRAGSGATPCGVGGEQSPPRPLSALLIHSPAVGVYGGRRIEQRARDGAPARAGIEARALKPGPGFRRFHLRGRENVSLEWALGWLACNLKRLHRPGAGLQLAQRN